MKQLKMGMAMGFCDPTKCKKRRWEQGGRDRPGGGPIEGKASIEMDSKPLLKHQKNIRS